MKISRLIRGTAAVFGIAVLLLSQYAMADGESLSFRLNPSGEVEAVVSGFKTNECGFVFVPPTSTTIVGNSISIVSPNVVPLPCSMPIVPPQPYQVVANLGVLPGASYNVTWSQGVIVLSAQLFPAALATRAVPAMGPQALLLTALLIGLLGAGMASRRRS